jgi:Icc protein
VGQIAPLRLVQITDCHLGAEPGSRLLDVDTERSLAAVLALVRQQQARIDALLVTGDISDHGAASAYRRFLANTGDLAAQTRWLPGNHDSAATMQATLGADMRLQRSLLLGNWHIVMLDSAVPGEIGGRLDNTELTELVAALQSEPQRHTLICVHHPVVPVGCAWLDPQTVSDAAEFWRRIEQFPQVRAVLAGHVHQHFDRQRGSVRVLTTPSTCVQFAPDSSDFRVDIVAPGYRWLDLHADGRIDTDVERVAGNEFQADLNASGY